MKQRIKQFGKTVGLETKQPCIDNLFPNSRIHLHVQRFKVTEHLAEGNDVNSFTHNRKYNHLHAETNVAYICITHVALKLACLIMIIIQTYTVYYYATVSLLK